MRRLSSRCAYLVAGFHTGRLGIRTLLTRAAIVVNFPVESTTSKPSFVETLQVREGAQPLRSGEYTGFLTDTCMQFARASKDGSLLYAFMDWRHTSEIQQAGEAAYDRLINVCCWVKSNGGMGSLYRSRHEMVFVFKKGIAPHINNVQLGKHGRYRTNVWEYAGYNSFGHDRDETLAWHPTVKPVPMLMDAIMDVTHPGDIVLDGFLGSGSTLIAAERTRRVCYGVELDPAYVDVTIQRWQRETGQRAVLADTGQTFDEVAAERGIQREVVS